jgi:hypothetical protein
MVQRCGGGIHINRGRVGEERGSKETDRCPLTHLESHRTLNMKVIGFGCGPWTWYKGVREIHMNKGRVGEERRGKEMNRCPLTLPPLQKHSITTCEDHQEVARSALVKGIELKMAALIWHTVPGYLRWNCAIFGVMFHKCLTPKSVTIRSHMQQK